MKAGESIGNKVRRLRLNKLNVQFGYLNALMRVKRLSLLKRKIVHHRIEQTKKDIDNIWLRLIEIERTRRKLMKSFYEKETRRTSNQNT